MATATATAATLLVLAAAVHAQSVCQTYTINAGDTIVGIASQFNVQQGDLETALGQCIAGYVPGTFLQPNQKICLPPWYDACIYVRVAGGEGFGFDDCKYYTVQSGDTLENIALSLGLNRLDLEAVNPGAVALQVNDFVKLPGWYDGCPAPGDVQPCRFYTAQASDSLASIAIAFSVDLTDLQGANELLAGDTTSVLQPGQKINIPPFTESCGAGVEVQKPASGNCNAYRVQGGDTLYAIAAMFQTTTQQIIDVNPALAAGGVLSTSTEVFIPPYNVDDCAAGINYVTPTFVVTPDPNAPAWIPSPSPEPTATIQEAPGPQGADTPAPAPAPGPEPFLRRRLV